MLVGIAVGVWLMPGPREVGDVTLNVHSLFYAAVAVLVGYQAVWFAVLARAFALVSRLLPPKPLYERLFRIFKLETGLAAGFLLILVGLGGAVYSVVLWGMERFGPLAPSHMLRIIVPSGVALTLGCQTVMSSFFLSLLGVRRK
jgi:hypothetical protein